MFSLAGSLPFVEVLQHSQTIRSLYTTAASITRVYGTGIRPTQPCVSQCSKQTSGFITKKRNTRNRSPHVKGITILDFDPKAYCNLLCAPSATYVSKTTCYHNAGKVSSAVRNKTNTICRHKDGIFGQGRAIVTKAAVTELQPFVSNRTMRFC